MATGINLEKMNSVKVSLLGYVEEINALSFQLDGYYAAIQVSLNGACRGEIISKFSAIRREWAKTAKIISSYIDILGKVEASYAQQDSDLALVTTQNIDKIEDNI